MNTHRTSPDNQQDVIGLKNLFTEAHESVINEFGIHPVTDLLGKINNVEKVTDVNYNLDNLHIFLSNSTQEIVRSPWSTLHNAVHRFSE